MIRWYTFFMMILYSSCLTAQDHFFNPFMKEKGFFISGSEEKFFAALERNQPSDPLLPLLLFSQNPSYTSENVIQQLENFCQDMEKRTHRSEVAFLKKIFLEVHRKYLKKYQRYATFDRLFQDGSYDCLTGTALYALVLDRLGFSYSIHETSRHSYLIAYANHTPVLLETTDPLGGFIAEADRIRQREEQYSKDIASDFNLIQGLTGFRKEGETVRIFHEVIGLQQITGLHYFNQGVIQYNIGQYRKAVTLLEKAYTLYPCKRNLSLLLMSIRMVLAEQDLSGYDLRRYTGKTSFYSMNAGKYFN
jgi:tetratricopeptide (TPR) repeat protein